MKRLFPILFLLAACSAPPARVAEVRAAPVDKLAPSALIERIGRGESKAFPVDRQAYDGADWQSLPIGVFDSGVGGLTVLNALRQLDEFDNRTHQPGPDGVPDFADERFVYFGDQANMPYGRYASEGKEDFLRELIVEDAAFLLGRRYWPAANAPAPRNDKPPVKAVVIACNTATAYGIEDIRRAFAAWKIPMILVGVVEAGAEGAVTAVKKQGAAGAVAVMATVGTCKSMAYPKTIERFAKSAGLAAPTIVQQGSVGLAGAIEGDPSFVGGKASYQGPAVKNASAEIDPALAGPYAFEASGLSGDPSAPESWKLDSVENYIHYDVTTLVEAYRKENRSTPIRTVVLGCTHFPLQRERIAASFERLRSYRDASGARPYESVVGPDVELVDPARLTARQLYQSLAAGSRLLPAGKSSVAARDAFFISKPNPAAEGVKLTREGAFDVGYKYGRVAGDFERETVRRVPLKATDLTPELQKLLARDMPLVWKGIRESEAP